MFCSIMHLQLQLSFFQFVDESLINYILSNPSKTRDYPKWQLHNDLAYCIFRLAFSYNFLLCFKPFAKMNIFSDFCAWKIVIFWIFFECLFFVYAILPHQFPRLFLNLRSAKAKRKRNSAHPWLKPIEKTFKILRIVKNLNYSSVIQRFLYFLTFLIFF